jgi:hypothetical protein
MYVQHLFSLKNFPQTTFYTDDLIDRLVQNVHVLGVDGLDLVQREGSGMTNMAANDETSIQV